MIDAAQMGSVSRRGSAVHLERRLAASSDRVWAAWTDPVRLGRWFAPVESGVPGPGQTFVLRMAVHETVTCTVTRWEPPKRLEMIWDYTGEGASRFRLRLRDLPDGGTHVLLDHDQFHPGVDLVEYVAGWHTHLEGLVAQLGGEPRPDFEATFRSLHLLYRQQDLAVVAPVGEILGAQGDHRDSCVR